MCGCGYVYVHVCVDVVSLWRKQRKRSVEGVVVSLTSTKLEYIAVTSRLYSVNIIVK